MLRWLGDARDNPQHGRLWALGALYGMVVATLAFVIVGQVAQARVQDQQTVLLQNAEQDRADIEQVVRLLVECTTDPRDRKPPEASTPQDCFVRGTTRTGDAVQTLNQVTIAAAACGADHPGNVPATKRCVRQTLKETR